MNSELESRLERLHQDVVWPVDDLEVAWSAADLGSRPDRSPAIRRLAIAAATVSAFVLLLVAFPQARHAVAGLLEAAGIKVFVAEGPQPSGASLDLGVPLDVAEAGERVEFGIRVPRGAATGAPDGVYLDNRNHLNMVWRGSEELPAATSTNVGLLLTQWQDDAGGRSGVKTVTDNATSVTSVLVEGSAGLWIEGAQHTITLLDAEGNELIESTRLAANVLLWAFEGVNYRLETTGTLKDALDLVESLEVVD